METLMKMIITDMGDDSYVYDCEIWKQGDENKVKIEIICQDDIDARQKFYMIVDSISRAQGYKVKIVDALEKSY